MVPDNDSWKPPVLFRFSVEFQWGKDKASASFAEVDGLGQELVFGKGEGGTALAVEIKVPDLVLKRALEPLDEKITVWIKNTFGFRSGTKIKPCNLYVSLLDGQNRAMARWECEWAFPTQWMVGPLNASESRIAVESIRLKYKSLKRSR